MLAPIEYDKKRSPVVVKSPMETTHEGWIERGKIAHEAIPFNAKYTELERFNALHVYSCQWGSSSILVKDFYSYKIVDA